MIMARPWGLAFAQQVAPVVAGVLAVPSDIPPLTPLWVVLVSMVGWVCSVNGPLAKRVAGQELDRRENVRRGLTSLSIGAIMYVLARKAGADDMSALIAAWLAGWLGDAAVNALVTRWKPPGL